MTKRKPTPTQPPKRKKKLRIHQDHMFWTAIACSFVNIAAFKEEAVHIRTDTMVAQWASVATVVVGLFLAMFFPSGGGEE